MPTTDHGVFVAAARTLLTDPNWRLFNMNNYVTHRSLTWDDTGVKVCEINDYGLPGPTLLDARPESVQQAVDYLVVAGVLPARLASWSKPASRPVFAGPSERTRRALEVIRGTSTNGAAR